MILMCFSWLFGIMLYENHNITIYFDINIKQIILIVPNKGKKKIN